MSEEDDRHIVQGLLALGWNVDVSRVDGADEPLAREGR